MTAAQLSALAAIGGRDDRIAAAVVGTVCAAAAVLEVVTLVRRRLPDRVLALWAGLTTTGAALWLVAAATSRPRVAILAVVLTGTGLFMFGAAHLWSRRPTWSLATTRVLVDVAAVGAGAAGLWVLARVPPRLADGTVVADRSVLVAVGIIGTPLLAYAVVGGSREGAGALRLGAALAGAGALVWADDRLRGGPVPATWAIVLPLAVLANAVLFRTIARERSAIVGAGAAAEPMPRWRGVARAEDVGVTAIEPSPLVAGIVEPALWMLIILFQTNREIELSVAITACIAASAIGLRSMSRYLDQARVVESLQQMANTDPLTGLPNRRGFARAMAECRPGALALVDLDGFKAVNDRLGHAAGDQLLAAVADEGRRRLPAGTTLARLGGDEFGLVVPGSVDDGVRVAEELVESIARLRLAGHVTASAGVAEVSPDVEATLRNAGFALHWAKRAGRGRTMQLSERMVDLEMRRSELAQALAADVERGQLYVLYQPIIRVADRRVVGAEALARWRHPHHGEVSAEEFIPIAEELGLIDRVGELVLDSVIAEIADWEVNGIVADVAVNVSGLQLRGPGIARRYADRVAAGGVRGRVSIEVTESAIVDDESMDTLELLRASGFRIAIDDFGTGYASISRFMRMRPDRLKIERRFVHDLGTRAGANSAVLVEAVIGIAHQFGVEVVAEGVETDEAMAVLADLGCDYAQGFLFGRPGPADEFVRALRLCQPSRGRRTATG
jgi:diguanylate cyclase (GGDEF)-like protein